MFQHQTAHLLDLSGTRTPIRVRSAPQMLPFLTPPHKNASPALLIQPTILPRTNVSRSAQLDKCSTKQPGSASNPQPLLLLLSMATTLGSVLQKDQFGIPKVNHVLNAVPNILTGMQTLKNASYAHRTKNGMK